LSAESYEKWRDSLEDVLYDLRVFGAEAQEDERYEILIAKTVQRLPRDVRERVLGKVNFIVAGGVNGTGFSLNVLNDVVEALTSTGELKLDGKDPSVKLSTIERTNLNIPFILLNFANMRGMPEEEVMSVIAHEIAHFILGHFEDYHKPWENREKEADNLIEKWGFRGVWRSNMKCSSRLKKAT
jgi:hypothetical protein